MMTVGTLKSLLANRADDEIAYVDILFKEDLDEQLEEQNDEASTKKEWESFIIGLNNDESLWNEMQSCFRYQVEKIITLRKENKGKANDNSK